MVADKITMLESCRYEDLAKHSKVFNLSALNYHLWIYLNPEDVMDAYFLGAQEIGPNANNSTIYPDTFKRESQCWIRVNTGYIDQRVGKHTIKLSFVDRYTDTDFSLYASYFIQNDDPYKPYVYMKQSEGSYSECSNYTQCSEHSGFTEYTAT